MYGWMMRPGKTMRGAAVAALLLTVMAAVPARAQVADLVSQSSFRVCADPGNAPMSHQDGSGFESSIATLVAGELGLPVEYTWFPMVTGFIRNTLQAGRCDVVIGYAQGHELVLNTNHYLVSTHVLITAPDSPLAQIDALTDPALQGKSLGVVAGTPPASHLARHGLMRSARGYDLFVDRRRENPAGQMLDDLEAGEIDAAILWGPIGGPLAKERGLTAIPLIKETATPRLFYRITMGVRAGEDEWKRNLNSLIRRNQAGIDRILVDAGVPVLEDFGTALKAVE
jgi:quinoprotein dehydrogenase-associated probable ABC transporter substrate-binding protein